MVIVWLAVRTPNCGSFHRKDYCTCEMFTLPKNHELEFPLCPLQHYYKNSNEMVGQFKEYLYLVGWSEPAHERQGDEKHTVDNP